MNQAESASEAGAEALLEENGDEQQADSGGWLDRFPEALDAAEARPGPAPVGAGALAFRVLFYAGMGVGVISALALLAAVFFQGLVATNFIQAGGDYLGSGPEARAAREVLGIPLAGFVVALFAGFIALAIGAFGVLRGRR